MYLYTVILIRYSVNNPSPCFVQLYLHTLRISLHFDLTIIFSAAIITRMPGRSEETVKMVPKVAGHVRSTDTRGEFYGVTYDKVHTHPRAGITTLDGTMRAIFARGDYVRASRRAQT